MLAPELSDYLGMLKARSPKLSEGVLALSLREQGWDDETIQEAVVYFITGNTPSILLSHVSHPHTTMLPPPTPSMSTVLKEGTSGASHGSSLTPSLPPELTQPKKIQPFPTLPPELLSKPSIVNEIIVPALKIETPIVGGSNSTEKPFVTSPIQKQFTSSHEPLPVGQAASDSVGIVRPLKVNVMPQAPVKKIEYINPEADQDERENPSTLVREGYRFTASGLTYLYLIPLALTFPTLIYFGLRETMSAVLFQGAESYGSLFALFSLGTPQTELVFDVFTFAPSVLFTVFLVLGVLLFTKRAFSSSGNVLVSFLSGNALYIFASIASIIGVQHGIPIVLKAVSGSTYTLTGSLLQLPFVVSYQLFIGYILLQVVVLFSYRSSHTVQKSTSYAIVQACFGTLGLMTALYVCGTAIALAPYVQKVELCSFAFTDSVRDTCLARVLSQ